MAISTKGFDLRNIYAEGYANIGKAWGRGIEIASQNVTNTINSVVNTYLENSKWVNDNITSMPPLQTIYSVKNAEAIGKLDAVKGKMVEIYKNKKGFLSAQDKFIISDLKKQYETWVESQKLISQYADKASQTLVNDNGVLFDKNHFGDVMDRWIKGDSNIEIDEYTGNPFLKYNQVDVGNYIYSMTGDYKKEYREKVLEDMRLKGITAETTTKYIYGDYNTAKAYVVDKILKDPRAYVTINEKLKNIKDTDILTSDDKLGAYLDKYHKKEIESLTEPTEVKESRIMSSLIRGGGGEKEKVSLLTSGKRQFLGRQYEEVFAPEKELDLTFDVQSIEDSSLPEGVTLEKGEANGRLVALTGDGYAFVTVKDVSVVGKGIPKGAKTYEQRVEPVPYKELDVETLSEAIAENKGEWKKIAKEYDISVNIFKSNKSLAEALLNEMSNAKYDQLPESIKPVKSKYKYSATGDIIVKVPISSLDATLRAKVKNYDEVLKRINR